MNIYTALKNDNEEVLAEAAREELLRSLERSPERTRGSTSSEGGKRGRNSSPFNSPRSPTRPLLDVDGEGSRRASTGFSTSYINHSPKFTPQQIAASRIPYRPLIDTSAATTPKITKSAATSPVETHHRAALANGARLRTSSDASNHPASFGARKAMNNSSEPNSQSAGNSPSHSGVSVAQKKSSQGSGWTKMFVPNAMSEVVRGGDLTVFGAGEKDRSHSTGGMGKRFSKSRSPAGWGLRSSSPGVKGIQVNGQPVVKSALRSPIPSALSNRPRADSGASVERDSVRRGSGLKNGEDVPSDSSDEEETTSSDDDAYRGRRLSAMVYGSEEFRNLQKTSPLPQDMMEATGQELDNFNTAKEMILEKRAEKIAQKTGQKTVPHKVQISQPLIGPLPSMLVTSPTTTEKPKSSRPKCRPTTSFDKPHLSEKPPSEPRTYLSTPGSRPAGRREVSEAQLNNPDAQADVIDIGHAQTLPIQRTVITDPHPSRSVRQIYRGNFSSIQNEAKDPNARHPPRLRKYLVATDLSSEATHALEWCIGTVLRDGDTLLAVYCVDEEVGVTSEEPSLSSKETATVTTTAISTIPHVTKSSSTQTVYQLPTPPISKLDATASKSAPTSPSGRRTNAELERHHAIHQITERVEKLLRKTILQVKVVIEVIHCKSPKHLITEIIDLVSPTLVVLGSRGRGALKGVLLGSFSNYLVTKSSVPVMVARKKLHGKKKFKRRDVQHANNLAGDAVRGLIAAKE